MVEKREVEMVELKNGAKEPLAAVTITGEELKSLHDQGNYRAIQDLLRSSANPGRPVDESQFKILQSRGLVDERGIPYKSVAHTVDASIVYALPKPELIDPIKR
jgi:hypothetical protein